MLKKFLKYIIIFISIIILFIGLLTVSAIFSSDYIKENVRKSSELLNSEGNRKNTYIFLKNIEIQFDNYTDALMLNTAYSIDNSTPLYSSFVARKNYVPTIEQTIYEDSVGELHSASKYQGHNEVGELNDTLNEDINESFEYARYWHGYLTLLRPILLIFSLSQIRIILTIIFILLAIIVFMNIYKKLGLYYMLAFLLGFLGVEYFYMGLSMQGCFIFIITMIFIEIILKRYDKIKDISIYFLIIGMFTNFLDFLTNPLITLFVPLILYFLLKQKENKLSIKECIIIFLKTGIPWVLGYGLTWLSKWILVDIIFNKNLLKTALGQVLYRTNGSWKINKTLPITQNLQYILIPIIVDIVYILFIKLYKTTDKNNKTGIKNIFTNIFPYLAIAIVPYIWYFIIKDHSYKHSFFTYREQIMTLISIPIVYLKILELQEVKELNEKNE